MARGDASGVRRTSGEQHMDACAPGSTCWSDARHDGSYTTSLNDLAWTSTRISRVVVKPATIRMVLHLAVTRRWPVHQLDVKNAFLHGDLTERIYCHQPASFIDSSRPDHVYLFIKSLYGLK